jgi:hypothetical protein
MKLSFNPDAGWCRFIRELRLSREKKARVLHSEIQYADRMPQVLQFLRQSFVEGSDASAPERVSRTEYDNIQWHSGFD